MKVPKPEKLPSGNWRIRLRLGGEEISITKGSDTACIKEARLIKAEYLAGKRTAANREANEKTLKELEEVYILKREPVLSPSTIKRYSQMKDGRFIKYSEKRIKDIKWQQMINDELNVCSPKTVRNAWGLVTGSLNNAGISIPNVTLAAVPVNETDYMQPEEVLAFCEWIKGRPYETAALLELHGLRLSELNGLTWKDIDTKRGLIKVRGAVVDGPNGLTAKKTNKNKTSTRTLPIMIPRLLDLLKEQETGEDEPVLKQSRSVLLRDVKRASKRAIGREITNHGLRHSFASLCYHLGRKNPEISERQLMAWGGWSDIHTMHKIYIRLAQADETAAAAAFRSFFDENKTPTVLPANKKSPVK